ncbi:MAG: GTP 3',8-cyclase MoaA [Nitrospira sp.]|jgi:cyclic pyranopterin phosphate synthase|nr:GTP 3',8-cyclase MoaA [Nitrospira sp.]MDH4243685.1 GTP 3',8-cyclase MoaA [Nitrospira sp.]MDH4357632.1 GTP 3',8-cyclase MoaA [Nitrospira sp.]MDH5316948.1 GTP 3',8-cyclase MoaA [Nitrospira sp.]
MANLINDPMAGRSEVSDTFGRPLGSLRLSVTDRCNLRCNYCMPEPEYVWLPREDILSFEEMATLARYFADLGVEKVRLTGGEPLLRRDLARLVRLLRQDRRITEVALTTNGILLADYAQELYEAGLDRVTVSLDTLRPERFRQLTGRDEFSRALEGIESVGKTGFSHLKLDTVAIRGFNEDELYALVEFAKQYRAEVRFIEYMDVGGANEWSLDKVLSQDMILDMFGRRYGHVIPIPERGTAPAQRFRLPDGTIFGIIPSTTMPFCAHCDRSRVTADGLWYLCLYASSGVDLRKPLRLGASSMEMQKLIRSVWAARRDRGAEDRKALERVGLRSGGLVHIDRLREDPHLEMHARGG